MIFSSVFGCPLLERELTKKQIKMLNCGDGKDAEVNK